jgi:hypothetical protein
MLDITKQVNDHMTAAIEAAGKPAMTRERIDAMRRADHRIVMLNVLPTDDVEDAIASEPINDECEEIEVTVPRDFFRDGWTFPHKITVTFTEETEGDFIYEGTTKTDAGYAISYERA